MTEGSITIGISKGPKLRNWNLEDQNCTIGIPEGPTVQLSQKEKKYDYLLLVISNVLPDYYENFYISMFCQYSEKQLSLVILA